MNATKTKKFSSMICDIVNRVNLSMAKNSPWNIFLSLVPISISNPSIYHNHRLSGSEQGTVKFYVRDYPNHILQVLPCAAIREKCPVPLFDRFSLTLLHNRQYFTQLHLCYFLIYSVYQAVIPLVPIILVSMVYNQSVTSS